MKIKLSFIVLLAGLLLNTECFSQNNQKKCTYKNGTISKGNKNIGRNVTVTYDVFFHKYTFNFTNSNGYNEKITFDGTENNSITYVCSKDNQPYTLATLRKDQLCFFGPSVINNLSFLPHGGAFGSGYYIANYK